MRVAGVAPRAGASGGTGEGGCPCLLSPVPILRLGVAYSVTGFAAAGMAGAAQPRRVGRGGGPHCGRRCGGPAPPGHLQGEGRRLPVSGPTTSAGPQPSKVSLGPAWQRRHPRPPRVPQAQLVQLPTCWKSLLLWIGVGLRTVSYKTGVAKGQAVYQGGRGLGCWVGRAVKPRPPSPPQIAGPGPAQAWRREAHSTLTLTDFAIDGHLQPQAPVFLVVDGFGCNTNPQGVKEGTFVGRK